MGIKSNLMFTIIIGVLFSIVIIVFATLQIISTKIAIIVLVNMVIIFVTMGLLSKVRPKPDERTKRLDKRATSWSYTFTFCLLCVLIILDNYTSITLSKNSFAGILLFFMIYSNLIIRFFFRKRSDVSD